MHGIFARFRILKNGELDEYHRINAEFTLQKTAMRCWFPQKKKALA